MKNIVKLLLVPVVVFAFGGAVLGQGTTQKAPAKPTAPAKTTEKKEDAVKVSRGRGELLAVDSKVGTAKVKGRDGEVSLNADTKETKDALAKVKVGDAVRFTYTEKDGKRVLRMLEKGRVKTESSRTSRQKSQKPESTPPTK